MILRLRAKSFGLRLSIRSPFGVMLRTFAKTCQLNLPGFDPKELNIPGAKQSMGNSSSGRCRTSCQDYKKD